MINAVHCRLTVFLCSNQLREHDRSKEKGGGRWSGAGPSCLGRTTLAPRASVSWAGRKGRGSARVCRAVHPHPRFKPGAGSNPLPSRERGCCARQVPACAGLPGGCAGMTWGCAGLPSCFTLTPGSSPGQALTLSHRGRGDVAPGTAPLGYRGPTAATLGLGVWRRWLRRVGCLAVCARRGLFALSTIKRGTPVVRSARLGQ